MKVLNSLMALSAVSCLALSPTLARADQAYGNFVLNISGGFRVPVTQGGSVNCSAVAVLVPDTTSAPNLGSINAAILLNSGMTATSLSATITNAGQNFSCQLIVPYFFNNYVAGQQMLIAYTLKGSDPGYLSNGTIIPGTHPSKTRQVIQITNVPVNGTNTTVPSIWGYL